jgi:hypothetical protein
MPVSDEKTVANMGPAVVNAFKAEKVQTQIPFGNDK